MCVCVFFKRKKHNASTTLTKPSNCQSYRSTHSSFCVHSSNGFVTQEELTRRDLPLWLGMCTLQSCLPAAASAAGGVAVVAKDRIRAHLSGGHSFHHHVVGPNIAHSWMRDVLKTARRHDRCISHSSAIGPTGCVIRRTS